MARVRTLLDSRRNTVAGLAFAATLAIAMVLAHGSLAGGHMDAMGSHGDEESQMEAVAEMCLAVLQVGGGMLAVLGVVLIGRRRSTRRLPTLAYRHGGVLARNPRSPLARAGPSVLQVYRL